MKRHLLLLLACALVAAAWAKTPELRFNSEGKFKILQFTDMHTNWKHTADHQKTLDRITTMVQLEQPDLLVFTGDNVTSKPAKEMWQKLLKTLEENKTPWCILFGNHDAEQDLTRQEIASLITAAKYTINCKNDNGEIADMEVPILSKDNDTIPFYLYCMDSHDYSTVPGLGGYGWFTLQQIEWLSHSCQVRTNTQGYVAPAVAFFHIPLVEYVDAWVPQENSRHGNSKLGTGIRGESICAGALNTGMFAAMRASKSIIATFAGHDHDNDFVGLYKNIALCYGRFSGGNATYSNMESGARVILLREGRRDFETWIRDDRGRCLHHVRCNGKELTRPKSPSGSLFGTKGEFKD